MPTLKRSDFEALCEALHCSDFITKRYLRTTLATIQALSQPHVRPITLDELRAKLDHDPTRMAHLLTALEKAGQIRYRYGAGLPEHGAWELVNS
jgi:hypothetical protein